MANNAIHTFLKNLATSFAPSTNQTETVTIKEFEFDERVLIGMMMITITSLLSLGFVCVLWKFKSYILHAFIYCTMAYFAWSAFKSYMGPTPWFDEPVRIAISWTRQTIPILIERGIQLFQSTCMFFYTLLKP